MVTIQMVTIQMVTIQMVSIYWLPFGCHWWQYPLATGVYATLVIRGNTLLATRDYRVIENRVDI